MTLSWNRFVKSSPFRNDLAYQVDQAPGSPIDSVTSPDPRTVVFKLKYVDSTVLGLLEHTQPSQYMKKNRAMLNIAAEEEHGRGATRVFDGI